jgi:hypothetical protein
MSKHTLDAGKAIISVVVELGEALGYVVATELPVEDRGDSGAVDVAWFSGDNQKFPLMIFEVESSATNAMANNPAKVFGQSSERFERPLFFFHIVVKSGMHTARIDNLRGVFGQHNYRVYTLERGSGTQLVEDILRQHRRIRSTINVGALVAALLNTKELVTDRLLIIESACQLELRGWYLRDLARLAKQGQEAEDLFLAHLLPRFWESRWSGTDEGYDTWFGSSWSTPIQLAILFAVTPELRFSIFEKLRWWQEESSYISQVGPHFGQSEDYDRFVLGVSGTFWALLAALTGEDENLLKYIAEQVWLTCIGIPSRLAAPFSYHCAAWGIQIAASIDDFDLYDKFRRHTNALGGLPREFLMRPPLWIDLSTMAEPPETWMNDLSPVPSADELRLSWTSDLGDGPRRSAVAIALEFLTCEGPLVGDGKDLVDILGRAHQSRSQLN